MSLENIGKFGDPAVCGAIEMAPWRDKHKTPGVIRYQYRGYNECASMKWGRPRAAPLAQF
jgi:hypothetical protein